MNKRQAKKAFKKQYGINPGQFVKAYCDFCDQFKKLVPGMIEIIKTGLNDLNDQIRIVLNEYTKQQIFI